MKGKFIVLEGIDGSGTSTQAKILSNYLFDKEGYHVFLTKEPTGFPIGQEIKRKLKEDKAAGINPFKDKGEEYTDLFIEDRISHVRRVIAPCLELGVPIVDDRFKYSTFTYQTAQGQDLDELIKRHNWLTVPDLVLILDLSAEEAVGRKVGDKTIPELFEKIEFLEKVRENYLSLKEKLPEENIVIIDGSKSVGEVFESIKYEVDKLFDF